MIIVKLSGGLGNQMFQYAAGRRLALMHDVQLKCDLSGFAATAPGDTPRNYALDAFRLEADFASPEETRRLLGTSGKLVRSITGKMLPPGMRTFFKERKTGFDPDFLKLGSNIYLEGFWQSEKYFNHISETILSDFTLRNALNGKNLETAEKIRSSESVSLHIRRGDYVSNPVTASYHGSCTQDYYRKAVEHISERCGSINLFIFSDAPDWVSKNLQLPCPMNLVTHNGENSACEDMRLMSLCRHNIIANSSFSWWGAWLNRNHNKLVVAPSNWFKQQNIDTSDLVPAGWHRI
jgi:hypothetical protein